MLEQSNAAHYLPNELPVRFLITENICLFFLRLNRIATQASFPKPR